MVIGQAFIGLIVVLAVLLSFLVDVPPWLSRLLIGLLGLALMCGGAVIFRGRGVAV